MLRVAIPFSAMMAWQYRLGYYPGWEEEELKRLLVERGFNLEKDIAYYKDRNKNAMVYMQYNKELSKKPFNINKDSHALVTRKP